MIADKHEGKRINSPNNRAIRTDGTICFTDPTWGLTGPHEIPQHWVFKLVPKTGDVEPEIKDLAMPNRINFSIQGQGKIHVYNADRKQPETIDVPKGPANGTFGGDDYKRLFIKARLLLYIMRLKIAGAKSSGAKW